ncbi:MAG: ribonuclease III [Gammaproteobacteria bacterium]
MKNKDTLCHKLGYTFHNSALLESALTHRSIRGDNNERLEFLGDAILNCVIATALFIRCPKANEGELSRLRAHLVKGETLAEMAQEFELGRYLCLGPGELKSGGARRKSILADALEAVIAAIYLDSHNKMDICQERVLTWFKARLNIIIHQDVQKDPKSCLQEYLQARKFQPPVYTVLSIEGEAHDQIFEVECRVEKMAHVSLGTGSSRRNAEQKAAQKYRTWLEEKND